MSHKPRVPGMTKHQAMMPRVRKELDRSRRRRAKVDAAEHPLRERMKRVAEKQAA